MASGWEPLLSVFEQGPLDNRILSVPKGVVLPSPFTEKEAETHLLGGVTSSK